MMPQEIQYSSVSSGLTYFENDDVVMAKVTPCFENGNIAIASDLTNGCAFGSSELFVFRCHGIRTRFLFYYLQNDDFKQECISTMTGTGGLKRVSPSYVRNSYIPLPDEIIQDEIIGYLDSMSASINSAIAKKQTIIDKLTDYKKTLIYEAVTGKMEV
jgi:type I restriction enzyme S subunit